MSKDAIFSTVLRKFGDKLIYANGAHESTYKTFVNSLEEGHSVQVFFDASKDDGTLAQLAKIKVCIRELAKYTGNTFEDTEIEIKKASGLCLIREIEGEKYIVIKSFGDCSKSDLSLAIQTIIQRGAFVNINFQ
jgi:hypothetical protein